MIQGRSCRRVTPRPTLNGPNMAPTWPHLRVVSRYVRGRPQWPALGRWAGVDMFARYAEARGVEVGKRGPKPDGVSATVAELAAELGVPERTAQRRVEAASLL